MKYDIFAEHHYMKPVTYTDKSGRTTISAGMDFEYVIRREDGSRVFRAQTLKHADILMERLTRDTRA
jgi:hypothetical protein